MPELAELKLTADYVNTSAKGEKFVAVKKSKVHKGNDIELPNWRKFKVKASSRGKELLLTLSDVDSDQSETILMTMGMSGHFQITNTGKEPKHAHLIFYTDDGVSLSFVDVRRFGKWKQSAIFSTDRGPDPTSEYDAFVDHVMTNLDKKAFNKPIHEALMNQRYFNGIGNYLRAEIIYLLETLHPNLSARDAIKQHPRILELCRDIPMLAYKSNGGSIKDWYNPFGEKDTFKMLCYGNKALMTNKIDSNGRRFWYDPKWDEIDTISEWEDYNDNTCPYSI